MSATLTGVPDFVSGEIVWSCWTVRFGEAPLATNLEWRSGCGRYSAGRNVRMFWAAVNGHVISDEFESLKDAMATACNVSALRRAA